MNAYDTNASLLNASSRCKSLWRLQSRQRDRTEGRAFSISCFDSVAELKTFRLQLSFKIALAILLRSRTKHRQEYILLRGPVKKERESLVCYSSRIQQSDGQCLVCIIICEKAKRVIVESSRTDETCFMADPNETATPSPLLTKLLNLASVDHRIADSHSIRSWLASAKKCFDQVSFQKWCRVP